MNVNVSLAIFYWCKLQDNRLKVLGTIGIDSTAMFHDIAFGANDAAATIAAFLGSLCNYYFIISFVMFVYT